MTTRLEVEHTVLDKGKITKSRKTLLELDDRIGVHETPFGRVGLDVKINPLNYGSSYYGHFYNADIIIDASQARDLAARLNAQKRRISVGKNGKGAQQIGREVTLFIHSDSLRREKKCYMRIAGFNVPDTERVEKR